MGTKLRAAFVVWFLVGALSACATTLGENQRFVVVPKRTLFKHYDMLTVSEMTKACYTPAAAKSILDAFCGDAANWPTDKVRKEALQSKKLPTAKAACIEENLRISPEDGTTEFKGRILKQGFDWQAKAMSGRKALLIDPTSVEELRALLVDSCRTKPETMVKDLEHAYWSQLPFLLSDVYDTRTARYRKVETGSPVSLIVNRVYLSELLDRLPPMSLNGQEIAVVLSVLDGSEGGARDTLVAFEKKIDPRTRLPIGDLLAYTSDNYRGQPIRVTITVFELDSVSIDSVRPLFTQAANLAKNALPVSSTLLGTAESLGKFLLSNRSDDIALKFTFQLYPWALDDSVGRNMGEPKIAESTYMVINTTEKNKSLMDDTRKIQLGWNLLPYWIQPPTNGPVIESTAKVRCVPYRPNYDQRCAFDDLSARQQVRNFSYALLTVSKTPMISGQSIIDRADQLLRRVAGMDGKSTLESGSAVDDAKQLLAGLAQSLDLLNGQQELLRNLAGDPTAALTSFAKKTSKAISEFETEGIPVTSNPDIGKAIGLIKKTVPPDALKCATDDECLRKLSTGSWQKDLSYDPISQKYFTDQ